jgi:ubiquinone/menaquinone biosynthesis C-methylase UbiE
MADQPTIDHHAFKQFERAGYSRVAEGYDQATAQVTSQVNDAMLDAVEARSGTRLLDVACGPGWLSAAAAQRGAIVTGLDFATNMLTIARARCPEAAFHEGDAEDLPFEAGQFDAVVCSLGFPHFPNPDRAIAEAFRVLTPGGRYAFTNWTPPARNPFMGLLFGAVQTHGTVEVALPPGPSLFRFGDPAECERALSAGGFVPLSVTEIPMLWPFAAPEAVVPGVVASTARLGPLLSLQTEAQRRNIETAIIEGANTYTTSQGVEIPTAVVLAVARKP